MKSVLGECIRKPDISFFANGRIDITANTAKMLGLSSGDVIDITDADGEQYLLVRRKSTNVCYRYEARCVPTNVGKRRCNNFRCYSRKLSDFVLRVTRQADVVRLNVGQPRQVSGVGVCLPLITSKYRF